jgi:tetratricopeptide (TPR) repeat protein
MIMKSFALICLAVLVQAACTGTWCSEARGEESASPAGPGEDRLIQNAEMFYPGWYLQDYASSEMNWSCLPAIDGYDEKQVCFNYARRASEMDPEERTRNVLEVATPAYLYIEPISAPALDNPNEFQKASLRFGAALRLSLGAAWKERAQEFRRQGDLGEAQECYNRALASNPDDAESWRGKARALVELGIYDQAINCWDEVLKQDPSSTDAWNEKGNSLIQLGSYDEAIKCYNKSIELNPNNPEAWNNKGLALYRSSKYDLAINCYERALEIDQSYRDAWTNIGSALRAIGRDSEAKAAFDRADELRPH